MDALRTSWDPPYRSHHQRWDETPSEQARRQRFRELRPLDPGLPYGKRDPEMPSRLERPKQQTYRHTRHYTGMENYEQLFDQLDATGANTTPIGTHGGSRNAGKDVVDPITQGFDMMRERFDRLESRLDRTDTRVDVLEYPDDRDPGPVRPLGEEYDWEFENHELGFLRGFEREDRNPNYGLRNRHGRNRQGETAGATGYRGRGGRHQPRRGGPDIHRRGQRLQRTNWDQPCRYRDDWDD